jgi:hypothetical protein
MHFDTKSYLKNTRNHTAKHALSSHQILFFENKFLKIIFKLSYIYLLLIKLVNEKYFQVF